MATSAAAVSSAIDAEYIGKLIKVVKETLAIVMRSANVAIDQNAEVDLGTKFAEIPLDRHGGVLDVYFKKNSCQENLMNIHGRPSVTFSSLPWSLSPEFVIVSVQS
ncbi:hypothetical protein ACROYT_G042390 [Oculina patagonica]